MTTFLIDPKFTGNDPEFNEIIDSLELHKPRKPPKLRGVQLPRPIQSPRPIQLQRQLSRTLNIKARGTGALNSMTYNQYRNILLSMEKYWLNTYNGNGNWLFDTFRNINFGNNDQSFMEQEVEIDFDNLRLHNITNATNQFTIIPLHVIWRSKYGNVSHAQLVILDRNMHACLWDPHGSSGDWYRFLYPKIQEIIKVNGRRLRWYNTPSDGPQGVIIGAEIFMVQQLGITARGYCFLWCVVMTWLIKYNIGHNSRIQDIKSLTKSMRTTAVMDVITQRNDWLRAFTGILLKFYNAGYHQFKKQKVNTSTKPVNMLKNLIKNTNITFKPLTQSIKSSKSKGSTQVKTHHKDSKGRVIYLNVKTNRYFVKRRKSDGSFYKQTVYNL